MRLKFIVGILLILAVLVFAILASGARIMSFIDIPSIMVVILIPAAIAFASWPVKEIGRAFSAPFDSKAGRAELDKSRIFFAMSRTWSLIAAFLGTMCGLVAILAHASDFSSPKLASNLAVMLLCIFTSLLLCLVLSLPLESMARRRLAEME